MLEKRCGSEGESEGDSVPAVDKSGNSSGAVVLSLFTVAEAAAVLPVRVALFS